MDRSKRWLIISLLISLGTLSAILTVIPETAVTKETFISLANVKPQYLLLAIVFHLLAMVAWGMRIKVMCGAVGSKISFLDSMKVIIPSLFAACITPSKFGGEPVRIYLLNKKGISYGDATAVVVGERLLDAVFLGIAMPISLFIFKDYYNVVQLPVFIPAVIFFILLMSILIYIVTKPEKIKNFSSRFAHFLRLDRYIDRIRTEIDDFHASFWRFVREGKRSLSVGMVLTALFWLLDLVIASLILIGLGLNAKWIASLAAQVIMAVFITIPLTPGSSGIAELGIASLYSVLMPASMLGVFTLTWRFVTYYINLIIGGSIGGVISFRILRDLESARD
ncbi:MAG: flippase-like domain-containing protein [Halobacteriota archaeon]|nr:flippase-like domain-containing protein [Halobacteriota archaeon]